MVGFTLLMIQLNAQINTGFHQFIYTLYIIVAKYKLTRLFRINAVEYGAALIQNCRCYNSIPTICSYLFIPEIQCVI